ncbi:MAG TPA: hypothetical protein VFT22_29870 [Kofleriaceae bacterium]|nr:hypothetical protein [Kofleriaceae bacterium]
MSDVERYVALHGGEQLDVKLSEEIESAWLRARCRDPHAPPPSPTIVRDHAQLENTLRNLRTLRVEHSWHDEVLRTALRSHRRATQRRWAAGLAVVAAGAGGVTLWHSGHPRGPELLVRFEQGYVTRGDEQHSPGEHMVITARADSNSDLRVYHNGVALARCPGDSRCADLGGRTNEQILELSLDALGDYEIVLVVGTGRAFPGASLDEYLGAVVTAKARYVSERVYVR